MMLTDITDRRSIVGFVSSLPGRFWGNYGGVLMAGKWLAMAQDIGKQDSEKPIETMSLLDGLMLAYTDEWTGVGLLEVLPEHQDTFGNQVVLIGPAVDREKIQRRFPGVLVFNPNELFKVCDDVTAGKHNGVLLARQIFGAA